MHIVCSLHIHQWGLNSNGPGINTLAYTAITKPYSQLQNFFGLAMDPQHTHTLNKHE